MRTKKGELFCFAAVIVNLYCFIIHGTSGNFNVDVYLEATDGEATDTFLTSLAAAEAPEERILI